MPNGRRGLLKDEEAEAARVSVPNPYLPLTNQGVFSRTHQGETSHSSMRERLLATTRKLIMQRRFTGFTVRELAQVSHTSSQTIHNYFGRKNLVMATAINEYTEALFYLDESAPCGESRIVSFATHLTDAFIKYPEYYLVNLNNTYFDHSGGQVFYSTHRFGEALLVQQIATIALRRAPDELERMLIAQALSAALSSTLLQCAHREFSPSNLKERVNFKVHLILQGVYTHFGRAKSDTV